MVLFRFAVVFLLIAAGVCFAYYVGTGQPKYRTWGLKILQWVVIAGLGFFGLLVLERLL